jgi:mannan endo-1,4-beta-mannosidase
VQATGPGTTKIHITLNSSVYEKAVPFGGDITFTVTATPTAPPPPTSLSASAITATSATISWVNGATDAGTTTTLQYRTSGVSAWTTASSTIAAGVTSFNIPNLASLTTYDVRAWHVRSGLSSTMTTRTGLFTTLDPNAITNFRVTGCQQEVVGAKTYNYFTLSWTSASSGGSFQIGVNTTSSSSGAAVILTVPGTARSGQVGGYLAGPTTVHRWFWIRYGSGPWIALADNPLATNVCAL